jgi:hypothetical protein
MGEKFGVQYSEFTWGSWERIDEFLAREQDAFRSAVTHIQLGFAAILISALLLSAYSFLSPLAKISQLDRKEFHGADAIFIVALAISIGIVFSLVVLALQRIRRALIRSLGAELERKAKAIYCTAEEFKLELPASTLNRLKDIGHYES